MSDGQAQEGRFSVDLRFHSILATVEQGMQVDLAKTRAETDHGTTIGDGAEDAVRRTLREHLPSGYSVGKGMVYDAYGDSSRQTDVVITNPDHPLSFPEGKAGTYVVDGVAAAGEVKSCLDVSTLKDSIAKGAAFKRLRMTVGESDSVMTPKDQTYMQQIGMVPPYFVVAFDNKVADDTLGDRLTDAGLVEPPAGKSLGDQDWANTPQPPLDAVCILGQGVWLYLRPDNPMGFQVRVPSEDGNGTTPVDRSGWVFAATAAPLLMTMIWLHASMPRVFRGRSVFSPYLIPNQRHLAYMRSQAEDGGTDGLDGAGTAI